MDLIHTLTVAPEKVTILSDVISEFISTIEDRCDGAFTICYKKGRLLEQVNLFIVTTDNGLLNTIHGKSINNDVCTLKVVGIHTGNFFNKKSHFPVDNMLKSGKIVYDKDGSLRMLQMNFEKDKNVNMIKKRGIVKIKPPIQYTRKPR